MTDTEVPSSTTPGTTPNVDPYFAFDEKWEPGSWSDVSYAKMIPKVDENSVHQSCSPVAGEQRQFECTLCHRTYKRKNDARIHVGEAHLELFKFFCWRCPHKTSRGWSFKRHLRNVHQIVLPKTRGIRKLHTGSVSQAYALVQQRRLEALIAEGREIESNHTLMAMDVDGL